MAMWYVSRRREGVTRMRVFRTRNLALRAACDMLKAQTAGDVEVGPMLESRDGNVFRGDQLRRLCEGGMRETAAG
jgi:hypothetical protein